MSIITYINDYGCPFYDPTDVNRIWALKWDEGNSRYGELHYSIDFGRTWRDWLLIPPYATSPTIAMDSSGNIYFAQSSGLYKVTRSTKVITLAITWDMAYNPHSWFNWAWGEDSTGNLYTSAYSLVSTGGQFVWKHNGSSWSKLSVLSNDYPNCRHIHSLHVNPYNDSIYVSWGDDVTTRGIGISEDGMVTVDQITESTTPGPTGITFTSEAVWTSTDITGGSSNELKSISDDTNSIIRWTVPSPYAGAPLYFVRAIDGTPNEMWVIAYNELADSSRPAIMKLTKATGVTSSWSIDKIIVGDDNAVNGNSYYQMATGLNGIIPDVPFIFVERIGTKGMYRIERSV